MKQKQWKKNDRAAINIFSEVRFDFKKMLCSTCYVAFEQAVRYAVFMGLPSFKNL